MTGPNNALEAGHGFFEAFGGGYDPKWIVGRMRNPWAIVYPDTSIKPYPSGVVRHPGMDTMKKPVEKHDIEPEDVQSIEVRTGANVIAPGPLRIPHANDELEAKFCVAFQMTAIVLRRIAGLSEFSDSFVQSPECQEMQKKVTAVLDDEIIAMGKDAIVSRIAPTTKDGQRFFEESDRYYRGDPKNPLTWDEVSDKFRDASQGVLSADSMETFLNLAKEFETLPNLNEILDTVTA